MITAKRLHICGIVPVLSDYDKAYAKDAAKAGISFVAVQENDILRLYTVEERLQVPLCMELKDVAARAASIVAIDKMLFAALPDLSHQYPETSWLLFGAVDDSALSQWSACADACAVCCTTPRKEDFAAIRAIALGYRFTHVGINHADADTANQTATQLANTFGFPSFDIGNSIFSSEQFELVKSVFKGTNGHIAIETNSILRAMDDLANKGIALDMDTLQRQPNGRLVSVYLSEEIGGFAFHLLQKQ